MNQQRLLELLEEGWSTAELQTLASGLGILWKNLGGDTFDERALALIEYCRSRGRLAELLNVARAERPHLPWHQVTDRQPQRSSPSMEGVGGGKDADSGCEARARRRADRWMTGIIVLAMALLLPLGVALFWWWSILEPLTYLAGTVLGLLVALFRIVTGKLPNAWFDEQLVARARKAEGCAESDRASRPAPTMSQADAEAHYVAHRLSSEVKRRFAPPERYVPQEGTAQVSGVDPLEEAAIEQSFLHLAAANQALEKVAGQRARQPKEYKDIIPAIHELRRVALLGKPGSGKSTTLRKVEVQMLERWQQNPTAVVPLFVPLSEWTDEKQSLHAFIVAQLGPLGPYLDTLLANQRAALLLDGLDQLPRSQRDAKDPQVQRLFQDYPTLVAVVSCRKDDYIHDLDFDQLLVTELDARRIRDFARYYLLGAEAGDEFFWKLAGGDAVRALWQGWEGEGWHVGWLLAWGGERIRSVGPPQIAVAGNGPLPRRDDGAGAQPLQPDDAAPPLHARRSPRVTRQPGSTLPNLRGGTAGARARTGHAARREVARRRGAALVAGAAGLGHAGTARARGGAADPRRADHAPAEPGAARRGGRGMASAGTQRATAGPRRAGALQPPAAAGILCGARDAAAYHGTLALAAAARQSSLAAQALVGADRMGGGCRAARGAGASGLHPRAALAGRRQPGA